MRSSFYAVEGLDGCGKTTITKHAGEFLTSKGIPNVVVESYPRDKDSEMLRDLWIQQRVPPIAVLSIILELRKRVLLNQIVPALLAGKMVISDRWHDTTWVYQHHAVGIPLEVMKAVYKEQFDLDRILAIYDAETRCWLKYQLRMHATIFLDVDLQTSRARVGQRKVALDAFEKQPDEFFLKLRAGYHQHYTGRNFHDHGVLLKIDATRPLESIKNEIETAMTFAPACNPPKPLEYSYQ